NSNYKRTAALAIRALPRRGPQRQDRRASAGARHSTLPCLEAAASMAAAMADSPLPLTLLGALKPRLPEMLRLLRRFVTTESPSLAKADRKSTRLNSSHDQISYAVFCLKKKTFSFP